MIRDLLFPAPPSLRASAGLLAIRLVCGPALMFHGWRKIQNPFGWMGEDTWAPGILQAMAALSEFGGGLSLVLGLLVPLSSFGILCTMGVAAMTHILRGDPFVGSPSWELATIFFCAALLMLLAGPGRIALDAVIFKKRPPQAEA
jgi:putative oxidoreductase